MDGEWDFEWDAANTGHIALHSVTSAEVEEVLTGAVIVLDFREARGEHRVICAGKTAGGRVLQIVYTVREGRIRVITAHESRKLRKFYETQGQREKGRNG